VGLKATRSGWAIAPATKEPGLKALLLRRATDKPEPEARSAYSWPGGRKICDVDSGTEIGSPQTGLAREPATDFNISAPSGKYPNKGRAPSMFGSFEEDCGDACIAGRIPTRVCGYTTAAAQMAAMKSFNIILILPQ
jgi:hypothetical protein